MRVVVAVKFALAALVAAWLPLAGAAGKCERLVATGASEHPPFLWRDPERPDHLLGANADLMRLIAKDLGLQLDILYSGDGAAAFEEVRSGRVDLLLDATLVAPRLAVLDFIHPAIAELQWLPWVRQGEAFDYQGREQLAGRAGLRVAGSETGRQFEAFARQQLQLTAARSLPAALEALMQRQVDYVLHERYATIAAAASLGLIDRLRLLQPPVLAQGMHLALAHDSVCNDPWLRGQLAMRMTALQAAGVPQQLLAKNFERWLEQQRPDAAPDMQEPYPE